MSRRPSASELLAWTLVGTALGVVAGFALGEWLGPVTRERAGRALRGITSPEPGPLRPSDAARAARRTLAGEPALKDLDLVPIGVGPGIVELHGWVPTRALRTRAARLVSATEGINSLVNCLLVRGEDDDAEPVLDVTDQPA